MKGFNKAILVGNLVKEPDVRYTAAGTAVAVFTIACNRSVKQKDGSYKDEADFIRVAIWGKSAEICEKYLKKGSGVLVEGRINTRSYEDNAGQKRYITEVVANSFQFVGGVGGEMKKTAQETKREKAQGYSFPMDISELDPVVPANEDPVDIPF